MKLNPSQEKAVQAFGQNVLVSAGAGSGKTEVLTQKVLYFIKNIKYDDKKFHIQDFLILTFTNAAAFEMRSRIKKELLEEGLVEEARNCDFADISTFDAFALNIVKKYHFELKIAENIALDSSSLIKIEERNELKLILDEYYKAKDPTLLMVVDACCNKDDKEIYAIILDMYHAMQNSLDKEAFYNNFQTNFINNYIFNTNDTKIKEANKKMLEIVKKLDDKIKAFKEAYSIYEFSDIAYLLNKLLLENADARKEIRECYKLIIVDEYQDTSPIQEAFLSLIDNNNLFMVGDIKQSIYRFRGADCHIFQDKYEKYKRLDGGMLIQMNQNYRARKEIIQDINEIFSEIFTKEQGEITYKNEHELIAGASFNQLQYPSCEYLTYDSKGLDSYQKALIEAKSIAVDILNKIENGYMAYNAKIQKPHLATFSSFTILVPRNLYASTFERVFKEYGIPLYVDRDIDISNSSLLILIKDITIVLKYFYEYYFNNQLFDATDPIFLNHFIALIRSFIYEVKDDQIYQLINDANISDNPIYKDISNYVYNNMQEGFFQLFKGYLEEVSFFKKIYILDDLERNEYFLKTILKDFKSFSKYGYEADEYLSYLDALSADSNDYKISSLKQNGDCVKMMTIHKSKGLEFDVVYFADLAQDFYRNISKRLKKYDDKYGIIYPNLLECAPLKDAMTEDEKQATLHEKIRLWYVALTRAKEKMILLYDIAKEGIAPSSFQNLMFNFKSVFPSYQVNLIGKTYQNKSCKEYNFEIKELYIPKEEEVLTKSSKDLSLGVKKETLDLGTYLHKCFETIDFRNPDYNLIEPKYQNYIKAFFESSVLKDLNNAKIYKEFKFIDVDEGKLGIIDLMIEYQDHVDIIDYKTKHLEDDAYLAQLASYKNYIAKLTSKSIYVYLYSIMDKTYKELDI